MGTVWPLGRPILLATCVVGAFVVLLRVGPASSPPTLTQWDRVEGALVGAVVADAAAGPLHWVYNLTMLRTLLDGTGVVSPAFYPTPSSEYSVQPVGAATSYGDLTVVGLKAMRTRDNIDFQALRGDLQKTFGSGTPYAVTSEHRERNDPLPVQGPWRGGVLQDVLENINSGKTPTGSARRLDSDGLVAAIPYVALATQGATPTSATRKVVEALTAANGAVGRSLASLYVLRAAVVGDPDPVGSTIRYLTDTPRTLPLQGVIVREMRAVLDARHRPHTDAVQKWGNACPYPGSFQGALHAIITSATYRDAVESTVRAGGSSAGRGVFVGAVMGAMHGIEGVPHTWKTATHRYDDVMRLLLSFRPK